MTADIILFNGRIHTLDAALSEVSALAISGNKILAVGDDATILAMASPNTERIDLQGGCAVPGLQDCHMHLLWLALSLKRIEAETSTKQELLDRVAETAANTPIGGWLLGRGWNHNAWNGIFPTAADLDAVAPNHPVLLTHKSGHAVWVNSAALKLACIDALTPDPDGGEIVHDADGNPSGILLEDTAIDLVNSLIPLPDLNQAAEAIHDAIALCHSKGLTGLHDMDPTESFEALQVLHQRGDLQMRITKSIPLEKLDAAIATGVRSGLGDDMLHIGQVKMFADGAIGSRTAWMLKGFEDAPDNTGIATTPIEILRESVLKANANGLGAAVHAIGDRACREMIDVFAEAHATYGDQVINRLEHAQILSPEDLPRLVENGVIASMQPIHATSDMYISDKHLGSRSYGAYAFKTLLDMGTTLAFGSDCPVEVIDPLVGIHAAVTRRRADGTPNAEGWHPDERLTVDQAVQGFAQGAAAAAGMSNKLGSLEPGKLADISIFKRDIYEIDPMEILDAGVLATIVDGQIVYKG